MKINACKVQLKILGDLDEAKIKIVQLWLYYIYLQQSTSYTKHLEALQQSMVWFGLGIPDRKCVVK